MSDIERDFVHLARLALNGQRQEVLLLVRRALPGIAKRHPELATELGALVSGSGNLDRAKIAKQAIPVDLDSRLELLRLEEHPIMPVEPTWSHAIKKELGQICLERIRLEHLNAAGVLPTRSMLFVGPPGVGKSLAARYLATQLQRPLLTLDLAAVMSSFLGRTGNNIRAVLEYARHEPSILLLDEFDAIAKRRDDSAEIGELKRLVTVLLQAIDDWPSYGILIAATNHPDLLDPAVWRRFERVLAFEVPDFKLVRDAINTALKDQQAVPSKTIDLLSQLLMGQSFAEIDRTINTARREAAISDVPLAHILEQLSKSLIENRLDKLDHGQRIEFAVLLYESGFSERDANKITGVARDTIRKHSARRNGRREHNGT